MVTDLQKIKYIFQTNIKKIDKDAKLITIKKYGTPYTTIDKKTSYNYIYGIQIRNTKLSLQEFKSLYRENISKKLIKLKTVFVPTSREEKQKDLFVGLIVIEK